MNLKALKKPDFKIVQKLRIGEFMLRKFMFIFLLSSFSVSAYSAEKCFKKEIMFTGYAEVVSDRSLNGHLYCDYKLKISDYLPHIACSIAEQDLENVVITLNGSCSSHLIFPGKYLSGILVKYDQSYGIE